MTLKILCVLVHANVPYDKEYVLRLQRMCQRHVAQAFDFYVLTDRPKLFRDAPLGVIEVPSPGAMPGWWSKLELFNPKHKLRGPALYLDLDVLLVGSMQPIADFPYRMALAPHSGTFEGRKGLKVVKRYNSSVMKFADVGAFPHLYENWTPAIARRLWGDQDWIGEQLPTERMMPIEWFPRISGIDLAGGPDAIPPTAKVVLCKKPKNHEVAATWRWFNEMWS